MNTFSSKQSADVKKNTVTNWADYYDDDAVVIVDTNPNPWITVPPGGGTKRMQKRNRSTRKRAFKKYKNN